MIRADEVRKNGGQIQFSLAALGVTGLHTKARAPKMTPAATQQAGSYQLNLSADRVLAGFTAAVCLIGVFFWVFVRLWLFKA